MSRRSRHLGATRRTPVLVLLVLAAAGIGASPAAAHDEAPILRHLTPTETRNQLALQAALAGNAPSEAKHASEHVALEAAEARFAQMSPARKHALRTGIRRATATRRSEIAARTAATRALAATATRSALGSSPMPLALSPNSPELVGAWTEAPFQAPSYAINMVMLPTGKVLVYSMGSRHADCEEDKCRGEEFGNGGLNVNNDGTAAVWDPSKGTGKDAFKILPPPNVDLTGYDLTDVRADPEIAAENADYPYPDQGAATPRPAPIFCSGQVQTADGRVLIAGGNLETRGRAYGVKMVFLFDPFTEQWTREPDMKHARWYPTLTRTASGRIAIMGGHDERGRDVASIELYPEQAAPVPGVGGAGGTTGHHTTTLYDDPSDPTNPLGYGDVDPDAAARGENDGLGYYPFAMVLPDGRLSIDRWGSGHVGILGGAGGPNVFHYLPQTSYTAAAGEYATAFPAPGDQRGTDEMITAGGLAVDAQGNPTTVQDKVWSIKPGAADSGGTDWVAEKPLNVARRNAVATLLPDGSAVILAGGSTSSRVSFADIQQPENHPQNRMELWDPVTRAWTLGPAEVTPRAYHSTAVLLPDGRVLSGGDDWVSYAMDADATDQFDSTFEIYSPPYLFKPGRPSLTTVPARVEFGGSFSVTGAAAAGHTITSASLVAPGAVTHAYDSNQRLLRLPVTVGTNGTVSVTAPLSGNAAPPGDYMLYLLDERGVPSIAKFVRVGAEHTGLVGPAPTTPVATTPAATTPTATTPTATTPAATTPKATTPAATTPTATTPAATTPKATTPTATTPAAANPGSGSSGTLTPNPVPILAPSNPGPVVAAPKPTTPVKPVVIELKLSGKRLTLSVTLTPSGKTCPKKVKAVVVVAGKRTKATFKTKPVKTGGVLTCRVGARLALKKKPKAGAAITAVFSGAGLKRHTAVAR